MTSCPLPSSAHTFAAILLIAWSTSVAGAEPSQGDRWARFVDDANSRGRHPSLAVEDAYRATLAAHAQGNFSAALEALGDFEDRFRNPTDTACLDKIRRHTLEELAKADPESLLPVLALYVSLWAKSVEPPSLGKAMATRAFLEELLAVYVRDDVPESAAVTSRLLVHWARLMITFGYLVLTEGSTEIFALALAYDPTNLAALEAGSMIHERLGDYKLALSLLEKRLEVGPDSAVVRLRVALNRLRSSAKADVAAELDALARDRGEPWIRILAYQQLAGYYIEHNHRSNAIETAREAREQFPNSEHVAIQLAFLLGDVGAGTDLAEQTLDNWRGDRGKSPRLVYEESPAAAVHAMTLRHADDVGQRLTNLATALESIDAPDSRRRRFRPCYGKLKLLR